MITPQDLADGAADAPLLVEGAAVDTPIRTVNLDIAVDTGTAARARERALHSDRLLVGLRRTSGPAPEPIANLMAGLDTTIVTDAAPADRRMVAVADPDAAAVELSDAVAANVHAAIVLGQVLRLSEDLPVPQAIDVESLAYSTLLGTPDFRRWLEQRGPRPLPPPAPQDPVLVRREAERLHITLNRPERRNAYGAEVRDGLVEALRLAILDDTITAIVLDGSGPVFSAGGDLDEFGTTPDLATAHLIRTRAGAARLVSQLADRIEVRVHGSCVGAGIEVPAFAGRIVATPGTVFRLPEVSMGLIPGAGGTVGVPRRIGRWRAFWLCATGAALDTETALAWGLVDQVSDRR
ncbi:enoyl-CoA hydratase/isomerase family protein [Rhodococcus oxybenzonivorans]|uniref:enoyl-CoA hydratase/isomerase family protein n=1 Tax=Rhodococcus oxybenzonivorans TaxID=1990687 RepID=UPI00295418A8|nr:enoyl-CoA hydratase/isomerase family protein [Rhodococcus oxybenzonivorans]MDV7352706.1 enoyl-CoA hydratase/isomerase family protein [Rhodococcus oxybenzonivorans]